MSDTPTSIALQTDIDAQLCLWKSLALAHHSHTIELYDAIPRYYFARERVKSGKITSANRFFSLKGVSYKAVITPAVMGDIMVFPGTREELIERALRKLAIDDNEQNLFAEMDTDGGFEVALMFTLSTLRSELGKWGHEFKIAELREGLEILSKTNISLITIDGVNVLHGTANIFQSLVLKYTPDDYAGNQSFVYVKFHPLIRASIKARAYRQIHYNWLMTMKTPLARWLFERISHRFTQAEVGLPYHLNLSTIFLESGMTRYPKISDNARKVNEALMEMRSQNLLDPFYCYRLEKGGASDGDAALLMNPTPTYNNPATGRKTVTDYTWRIYLSDMFCSEIIKTNKALADLRKSMPPMPQIGVSLFLEGKTPIQ